MNIVFVNQLHGLGAEHFRGFFAGWSDAPGDDEFLRVLQESHQVWLAMDGGKCVGFINAISDGGFSAFIPLLEVLPDYQGRGVGTGLVRRMMTSLGGHYSIDIVCDGELAGFYERNGFSRMAGMGKRNHRRS